MIAAKNPGGSRRRGRSKPVPSQVAAPPDEVMNFDVNTVKRRLERSQEQDENAISERGRYWGGHWAAERATKGELGRIAKLETGQATWSSLSRAFETIREWYPIG